MTGLDVVKLAIGFLLGILGKWLYDAGVRLRRRNRIKTKYKFLARTYANFRGGAVDTGGFIDLEQNSDGTFKVTAFHPDKSVDWRSTIKMSFEDDDIGTGHYKHEGSGRLVGIQQVRYIPEEGSLLVIGVSANSATETKFMHVWKPIAAKR
jgi:hypothetical protein